jgi:hypothetical protein
MPIDTNFDDAFDRPIQNPVRVLIEALRSPLPEGFKWNFGWYENCALGLALRLGIVSWDDAPDEKLSVALGGISVMPLSSREIDGVVPRYGVPARDVTPAMVADALEKLITEGDALERLLPVEG